MIYTKQIVKDKFWIVENSGVKIGTIRFCSSDDFELNLKDDELSTNEHISLSELTARFGEKILEAKETTVKIVEENTNGHGKKVTVENQNIWDEDSNKGKKVKDTEGEETVEKGKPDKEADDGEDKGKPEGETGKPDKDTGVPEDKGNKGKK